MSDMSSVSPSSTALTPASASISDSSHSMSPSSASAGGSRVPGGSADADPQEREIAGTSTGGRMGPGAGEGDGGGGETSSVVVPRLEHQTGASAGASSSIEVGPSGRTDPSLVQEGERPVDGRDEAGSGSRSGTHQPLSGMGQPEPSKQDTQAPEPGAESEGGGGDDGLNPELPELPWAFIECPTDDLIVLIAHMLNRLMEHNDQVILTADSLTRFHSRAPPQITVLDYLRRIVKYTNLEKLPLLSLLAYIDLTCATLPSFTLSSLTVHRFLISGVTAGSKALCDVFCTNGHYAKVGGIKVGELNALEREFLKVTDWNLCVHAELLQQYYSSLIRSHGGYRQASEPEVKPFTSFPLPRPAPAPVLSRPPASSSATSSIPASTSALASSLSTPIPTEIHEPKTSTSPELPIRDIEMTSSPAIDTADANKRPHDASDEMDVEEPAAAKSPQNASSSSRGSSRGAELKKVSSTTSLTSPASDSSSRSSARLTVPLKMPAVASPRIATIAVGAQPVTASSSSEASRSKTSFKHFVGGIFRPKSTATNEKSNGEERVGRGTTPRIRSRSERSADSSVEDMSRSKSRHLEVTVIDDGDTEETDEPMSGSGFIPDGREVVAVRERERLPRIQQDIEQQSGVG